MKTISLYLGALLILAHLNCVKSDNGTTTAPPTTAATTTISGSTTVTNTPLGDLGYEVHCKFQPDSFVCDKPEQFLMRWYYDIRLEDCKKFKYYECGSENKNLFGSYDECRGYCRDPGVHAIEYNLAPNAACIMQPDFGECKDYIPMFYFDMSKRRCVGFAFSGCGGNQNRFYNTKDCTAVCLPATETLTADTVYQNTN